jgi:hypothetical protein
MIEFKITKIGCFIWMLYLISACRSPTTVTKNIPVATTQQATISVDTSSQRATRPLLVLGGTQNKQLYAGFANPIQLVFDGEDASDLIIYTTGGRIDTLDKSKGQFIFKDKIAGSFVEIIAENPSTGVRVAETFDVIDVPSPEAFVWKSGKAFRKKMRFSAAEFIQQDAIILMFDVQIPILCGASRFNLLRIDTAGKRTEVKNEERDGVFEPATQQLIQQAKIGDIYIFKNISSNCTNQPIRDIAYVIQ